MTPALLWQKILSVFGEAAATASFLWSGVEKPIRFLARALASLGRWSLRLTLLLIIFIAVTAAAVSTPKDRAYRTLDPESTDCNMATDESGKFTSAPWDILATRGNDENRATLEGEGGRWGVKLRCALQRHEIPYAGGDAGTDRPEPLRYTLAFLEFKENGEPYELIKDAQTPFTMEELTNRVGYIDRSKWKPVTQLEALSAHLKNTENRVDKDEHGALVKHSNYVIFFVHGWRHDASIGDGNVSDLRAYAGHVARYLRDRCGAGERQHCGREVTAVYVGWRGARLDEASLHRPFDALGNLVGALVDGDRSKCSDGAGEHEQPLCWKNQISSWGDTLASGVAVLTLFDRKPVSEYIAPHVLMAIRQIEWTLGKAPGAKFEWRTDRNRMIVFGHSLGGNMLATALKDHLIKAVRNHPGGDAYFEPPLGDIVVLINPAAEAAKWTDIQRAVWERIAFFEADGPGDVLAGHHFFPSHQNPVVISVTSAYTWPPGGIRAQDCAIGMHDKLKLLDRDANASDDACTKYKHFLQTKKPDEFIFRDAAATAADGACAALRTPLAFDRAVEDVDRKKKNGIKSDLATYLAFPLFRGDFRPLGDMTAGVARDWRAACETFGATLSRRETQTLSFWQKIGEFISDLPFQNTDLESSRTIGHFDPPRSSVNLVEIHRMPARQLGTTHEIRSVDWAPPHQADYEQIPTDPAVSCPLSHDWLTRARRNKVNGTQWESASLSPPLEPDPIARHMSGGGPAVEMTHGFRLAGMLPITRANDPFWNMRAYDDVLMSHGGFMFSAFICAMNQFVMDQPTRWPVPYVKEAPPAASAKGTPASARHR